MTTKAVVFNLGIIWDELIHGDLYFDTIKKIKSPKRNLYIFNLDDYKIRDPNVNPISKNSLFEMMYKDPSKRLELSETKKRLSLQKYIALEIKKQNWTNKMIPYLFYVIFLYKKFILYFDYIRRLFYS